MLEKRTRIAAGELIAACDVEGFTRPDLLDAAVDAMLDFVAARARIIEDLEDGLRFRFGWSLLTLRQTDDGFVLCEPDFQDPHAPPVDHVSVTAQVAAVQRHINERTGTPPTPCASTDILVALDGALDLPELLLVRGPMAEGHSGWIISPRHKTDTDALIAEGAVPLALPTSHLVTTRPHLLKVLTLPLGTIVLVDGDAIISIRDADNQERFTPSDDDPTWVLSGSAIP